MYKQLERANDFSNTTTNSLTLTQYYDWLSKAEQAKYQQKKHLKLLQWNKKQRPKPTLIDFVRCFFDI